jgi:hypothetical protein
LEIQIMSDTYFVHSFGSRFVSLGVGLKNPVMQKPPNPPFLHVKAMSCITE